MSRRRRDLVKKHFPDAGIKLSDRFPGAKSWGVMGNVSGSWRSPDDWCCKACGDPRRLVVWGTGPTPIYCDCWACYLSPVKQLTLDLEGQG
jgi:hypothetical protein